MFARHPPAIGIHPSETTNSSQHNTALRPNGTSPAFSKLASPTSTNPPGAAVINWGIGGKSRSALDRGFVQHEDLLKVCVFVANLYTTFSCYADNLLLPVGLKWNVKWTNSVITEPMLDLCNHT